MPNPGGKRLVCPSNCGGDGEHCISGRTDVRASFSLLVLKYILAGEQAPIVGGEGSISFSAWPRGAGRQGTRLRDRYSESYPQLSEVQLSQQPPIRVSCQLTFY